MCEVSPLVASLIVAMLFLCRLNTTSLVVHTIGDTTQPDRDIDIVTQNHSRTEQAAYSNELNIVCPVNPLSK